MMTLGTIKSHTRAHRDNSSSTAQTAFRGVATAKDF